MKGLLAEAAALFVVPAATTAPTRPAAAEDGRHPVRLEWQPPVLADGSPTAAVESPIGSGGPDLDASRPDRGGAAASIGAVVIGGGSDALALGAALAGELRLRQRARTALLLIWDPAREAPVPLPGWPAARRLAGELGDDADVAARGRLVAVRLPAEASAAAGAAQRLTRSAGVPTVLVLGGARSSDFDVLLAERDLLVVLQGDDLPPSLARLAADELRDLNPHVLVERPIGGGMRRVLALAGLTRARRLRVAIDELLPC